MRRQPYGVHQLCIPAAAAAAGAAAQGCGPLQHREVSTLVATKDDTGVPCNWQHLQIITPYNPMVRVCTRTVCRVRRAEEAPGVRHDFRIVKVKPDGKCMFRALASGMSFNQGFYIAGSEEEEADAGEACA